MTLPFLLDYMSKEAAVSLLQKCADAEEEPSALERPHGWERVKRILAVSARPAAGLAAGTVLGVGGAAATHAAYKAVTGKDIPTPYLASAAAVLGAGSSLAGRYVMNHMFPRDLKRADQGYADY
jgi:hypothetical protein